MPSFKRVYLPLLLAISTAAEEPLAGPEILVDKLTGFVQRLEADAAAREAARDALKDNASAPAQAVQDLLRALEQGSAPQAPPDPELSEFFERQIRPLLAEHCISCHGPDKQKNGLRLDSREAVLRGGVSGPAAAPGDPAASLLVQVIEYAGDIQMPPQGKLPDEAVEALRHWIAVGAPWPAGAGQSTTLSPKSMEERIAEARAAHWAFQPVTNPAPPEVAGAASSSAAVDRFILKKLEEANLTPSPRADRRTLIRRVTFDLLGLPPTPQEVEDFVNDDSPEAYATLVDRLLASPRYGERWGRYWLDVARYADTRGYVFQMERDFPFSYTYRDYVIRAFNEDLPYDQFLMQQLAADRLDLGDDKRPLAALGFLTLGRHFLGNVHDITDDRIDVVTRGLQGLTVSCARCHDHKYDPVPIEDYYSLYGIFRSSVEPEELPRIEEPDPSDPQYQDYQKALHTAEQAVQDFLNGLHVDLLTQARSRAGDYLLAAWEARGMTEDEPLRALARDKDLHWQLLQRWREYLKAKSGEHDPVFAPWTVFAALAPESFEAEAAALAARFAANEDKDRPINPRIAAAFAGETPKSMAAVAERYGALLRGVDEEWSEYLASQAHIAAQQGAESVALPAALPDLDAESVRLVLYGKDSPANIPAGDVEELKDVPTQNRVRDLRNGVMRVKASHPGRPDCAMALFDSEVLFDPYVFERGKPENKGPAVPRRYLAVLARDERAPYTDGSGRLELAQAIASKENPLTARVLVNRLWMHHFGRPLVDTPSDFGLRCTPPSHPELLDYLAWQFMENGWSIKGLHRMMLLTETYQQSCADNATARAADPENRLLWRQNRRRLDFEAMRDALLASAGHLDTTMGGPSVQIVEPPFSLRRTVYCQIERQNLPGMFRTFDFAGPDTHSPKRYFTTVPQQALFLMNSPFVIEQARALMARPELAAGKPDEERIRALYALIQQREPAADEIAMGLAFLAKSATSGPPDPPRPPDWLYGYGHVDEAAGRVASFAPLPHFSDATWKGGPVLPDPTLGWVSLNAKGGHPGETQFAAIRRWVAPVSGMLSIEGQLRHGSDKGNGVTGYVVSSRTGIVWTGRAHNSAIDTNAASISVERGDTLDLVVDSAGDTGWDGFEWHPRLWLTDTPETDVLKREWLPRIDFAGPTPAPPEPLHPWEQYAQVLLLTNEFMFVD
ncbi:MAG: PSD1 domain-containing protein [Candidatus Hydrogenedentes bacterium]|nr:PSD1 domain-containing protein [Candidatus Hydrogenedentota bacterium]